MLGGGGPFSVLESFPRGAYWVGMCLARKGATFSSASLAFVVGRSVSACSPFEIGKLEALLKIDRPEVYVAEV